MLYFPAEVGLEFRLTETLAGLFVLGVGSGLVEFELVALVGSGEYVPLASYEFQLV